MDFGDIFLSRVRMARFSASPLHIFKLWRDFSEFIQTFSTAGEIFLSPVFF